MQSQKLPRKVTRKIYHNQSFPKRKTQYKEIQNGWKEQHHGKNPTNFSRKRDLLRQKLVLTSALWDLRCPVLENREKIPTIFTPSKCQQTARKNLSLELLSSCFRDFPFWVSSICMGCWRWGRFFIWWILFGCSEIGFLSFYCFYFLIIYIRGGVDFCCCGEDGNDYLESMFHQE